MHDILQLLRLLLPRRRLLVLSIVFAALSAGGLGAGLIAVKPVIDAMVGAGRSLPDLARDASAKLPLGLSIPEPIISALPTDTYRGIIAVIIAIGLLTVLGATANFFHQYFALTLVIDTVADLRQRAFARVLHMPLRALQSGRDTSPTDAVSRIAYDTSVVSAGLSALVSKALAQITKGLAALVAAMVLDLRVTLVVCAVAPILAIILRKTGKKIRRAATAAMQSQAGLYRAATEALAGLRVVKVHTTEAFETARFTALSQEMARQERKIRTARSLASPVIETIVIIILGVLVIVSAKAILDGAVDRAAFFTVLAALGVAGASLRPLTGLLNDVQHSSAAVARLHDLLSQPTETPADSPAPITPITPTTAPATLPPPRPPLPRHHRSITFDNVSLQYPNTAAPAVRNLSLSIPHGHTVAFVGPNGSGKTSLLALVPRLYDPDPFPPNTPPGRVLIDDTDIASVDLHSLRAQIAVVTQDTVLFHGPIRDNIAYGNPSASLDQIRHAARRARAEDFILAKPRGYDEPLGESGAGLSGGQKQRLAIARAILRDPAILILDEATSMIDSQSEHAIADAIDDFVSDAHHRRTCLIVAHRLATVISADLIVVMHEGTIADQGTHAQLLQRCDLYRQLVSHQLIAATPAPTPTQPAPAPA